METLSVGMYIRTKDGIIDKILKLNKSYVKGVSQKDELYAYDIDNIVKASYNIIDILEVGDIIKLFMEDDIDGEDTNIFELIAINYNDNEIGVFNSDFQIEFFPIENLRGILTHEQMEQMAYKVGD